MHTGNWVRPQVELGLISSYFDMALLFCLYIMASLGCTPINGQATHTIIWNSNSAHICMLKDVAVMVVSSAWAWYT